VSQRACHVSLTTEACRKLALLPYFLVLFFFFSSRRRHTRFSRDWSSDVCSSDLREGGRKPIRLCSAPVEIGPHLASWLRQAIRSVVMCSATLTVNGSFDYVTGRWGIQTLTAGGTASVPGDVNFCTAKIDSPFD